MVVQATCKLVLTQPLVDLDRLTTLRTFVVRGSW